jgi:predicted lipid-binding transport protein (Tim44 family)
MNILIIWVLLSVAFFILMWAIVRFGERSRAKGAEQANLPAVRDNHAIAPKSAAPARPVAKATSKPSSPSGGWASAASATPPHSAPPVGTSRPSAPLRAIEGGASRQLGHDPAATPSLDAHAPPLRLSAPRVMEREQ